MYESRISKHVKVGYVLAVLLWCASLVLPAAQINESMDLLGYRVFLIGIDALSAGMPGWLANPVAAAAISFGLGRWFATATVLSGVAFALTLSSFYAPALARAQGMPIETVNFQVGFFLWLAACSVILATSAYALLNDRRIRRRAT